MSRRPETVIMIEGIHNAGFAARIYGRVVDALARVYPPPSVAKIIFAGESGPKSVPDTRCTIAFHLPRRRDLSVTETGESREAAFDAAYDALTTSLTRESERRRELVRRPKKYFLAKRLLVSAERTEALRGKRARRRRVA